MAKRSLDDMMHRLRKAAAARAQRALPDGELLECFVTLHDDAAFTALIERHAPMVLGVCRRMLPNFHDAEDACQATFLVLARKAGSVRKRTSLSSWLHGVACRVAAGQKREYARRRVRERGAHSPAPSDPAADVTWREVQAILDEELQRLPERYQAPIILCYLDCLTRDEAAERLGLTPAALHGRLERARARLRSCLGRRGLTLAAALSAVALGEGALQASLAPSFVVSSTKAAILLAAGQPLAPGMVAAKVITLMREVLMGMFLTKLKVGAAALVCAAFVTVLIGGSFPSASIAQVSGPDPRVAKAIDPVAKDDSDAEFIRRVSKELRDSEPTPAEVHFFVSSKDSGRRQKLVELFKQERLTKHEELKLLGAPARRVELRARVTGYLVKVNFKAGEIVKKDQVLFEIDPRPYQAALDLAQAQFEQAEAKFKRSEASQKRAKILHEKGALPLKELEGAVADCAQAEANRKLAVAGLDLAKLNISFTKVSAMIDGKVGAPALTVGNLVTADVTPLAVVESVDPRVNQVR